MIDTVAPRAVVALFVPPALDDHLLIALRSLVATGLPVVVGGPYTAALEAYTGDGRTWRDVEDPAQFVNEVWAETRCPVLVVDDAVSVPPAFIDRALAELEEDLRIGSVSFLSNDAGFLSFPERNRPLPRPPEGQDATSVTRLLRSRGPAAPLVPIPRPAGAAVLLSPSALGASGGLATGLSHRLNLVLAEFAARTRARGFLHMLDDTTFYGRHRSPISMPAEAVTADDMGFEERHVLNRRYPMELEFINHEAHSPTSPLALSFGLARAKVRGLRVLVDGSMLGPHEMGSQVGLLATVDALRQRDDVREVVVAMTNRVPDYASDLLHSPKVTVEVVTEDDLSPVGRCDVAHRMIQPDPAYDPAVWREVADRVVVSVLDLIAYRIGSYQATAAEWLAYRAAINRAMAQVDGVAVISEDVRRQILIERLPIDESRLAAITFGTEHLSGTEAVEPPAELLARGFDDGDFVVCLGTDYTHKNKDLALRAVAELRRRGWPHRLVMAGPTVPYGSSRLWETTVALQHPETLDDDVFLLPELTSAERNWLMRHAALVLYPSSAEGFGLVPYEAAQFGTPTVLVPFGPLNELVSDAPVAARDWSPEALADAAEALLRDGDLADAQVKAYLNAATAFSWASSAGALTALYYRILALPPRHVAGA